MFQSDAVPLTQTVGQGKRVRRIAHLSDVHMLERRANPSHLHNLSLHFLSFGRALDPEGRRRKLHRALAAAERCRADHFVISGDLTEVGAPDQFEAFAEALHDSGIHPHRITLVPGNHDAYTSGEAWKQAIEGPLRAFSSTSSGEPGKVVDRGDVVFLPVDVTCLQAITRSAGELTPVWGDAIERRFTDPGLANKAMVVVQHHQPFAHSRSAWQWIDGLRGHARLMDLLARHRRVQLLHGHMHKIVDRLVDFGKSRIFGAPAIVDDTENTPRVRLYDVRDGLLEDAGMCAAA